ncbi:MULTISPECIES: hypothetical protein [Pseudomonas]|uniref:PsiF repeat-containing protein n=1 Tax=Pseudomonas segetis TaxID=298908 RepID=A0A238ZD23_9PSED|nr:MULTISPECIES: hypothetical protein [Pseudomonas]SNR81237.1 hypothetical protein SAMN05216255_0332 [Pseudomonas segetis]
MYKLLAGLSLGLFCLNLQAGVIDPDCTPEKAAKSAAMKATVGVGGRCDAKEAASDSMGLDDKKDKVDDAKDGISDKKDRAHDAKDDLGRKTLKKAL